MQLGRLEEMDTAGDAAMTITKGITGALVVLLAGVAAGLAYGFWRQVQDLREHRRRLSYVDDRVRYVAKHLADYPKVKELLAGGGIDVLEASRQIHLHEGGWL